MSLWIVLSALHLTFVVTGMSLPKCTNKSLAVAEGDDVILQCHLDPPTNPSAYTMDWSRVDIDHVVYSYRHGVHNHDAQMERYKNRTTFNLDGPSRGDLTLRISSAQLDDSGPYRCFIPKLICCDVNVSVVPNTQQKTTDTTTRPPVEDVFKSDHHDAAKKRTHYPTAVAIVILILLIIGLLVKSRRSNLSEEALMMEGARNRDDAKLCSNGKMMNGAAKESKDLVITVENILKGVW